MTYEEGYAEGVRQALAWQEARRVEGYSDKNMLRFHPGALEELANMRRLVEAPGTLPQWRGFAAGWLSVWD